MAGTSYKGSEIKDVDQFLKDASGLESEREKEIGQHIGYRYDVNLIPDYSKLTPFLKDYMEFMGWDDLNWLEDVHMGYEEGEAAIFDRNVNGWVRIPKSVKLPKNQQDRDMIARELLIRFQIPQVLNHSLGSEHRRGARGRPGPLLNRASVVAARPPRRLGTTLGALRCALPTPFPCATHSRCAICPVLLEKSRQAAGESSRQ
jgi:hypothetical protein